MTLGVGFGLISKLQPSGETQKGKQLRAREHERRLRAEIAGLLHPDRVARVDEQPRQEVEGALSAGGDDHLLGSAAHAASGVQVVRDFVAETRIAENVVGSKQRLATGRRPARQDAAPLARTEIPRRRACPDGTPCGQL